MGFGNSEQKFGMIASKFTVAMWYTHRCTCRMNDLRHNYAFLFRIRVCLMELKNQNPFEFCKLSTGTDSKVDSKVYFRLM